MNEAKEITKERSRLVTRKNSRGVEIGVWVLVALEVYRLASPYLQGLSW